MYARASQCAASLRRPSSDDLNTQSESIISTALSLISQTARFVEEKARNDPSLGVLSLAVLAKTKTAPDADVHVFRLWGPRLGPVAAPEQSAHPTQDQSSVAEQQRSQHENLDEFDGDQHAPCTLFEDPAFSQGSETTETRFRIQVPRGPMQVFEIDDKMNAKCLSLLLDASGITAHPSCYRSRSHVHISAPVLRNALRRMMTEYKKRNGNIAKDAKYSSLLPSELRDRRVSFSSLFLTRVDLLYRVSGSPVRTILTVRKPDRNKKEVHFAFLAALLQVDSDGICAQELEAMAKLGFGPSGCSAKPGPSCGGPDLCCEALLRPISHFLNECNEILGSGEVYPSVSYFQGQLIPRNMLLVRFSSRETDSAAVMSNNFYTWRSDLVSRFELLDAYDSIVGTAIVATYALQEERKVVPLPHGDLDISEAVVVCNVRISADHVSDRYCFLEWYGFGSGPWREVHDPYISQEEVPKTLGQFESLPCGLWHNKYVRKVASANTS